MFSMLSNAQNVQVPCSKQNYIAVVQSLNYASLYSQTWPASSQQHRWKHKLAFLSCFYGLEDL